MPPLQCDATVLTLCVVVLFLVAHFAAYAAHFRNQVFFRTERGILLFHLAPALAVPVGVLMATADQGPAMAALLTFSAAAAHGIYSLTFLELWALAEGSFSLPILRAIRAGGNGGAAAVVAELTALGDRKKAKRARSLLELSLASEKAGVLRLTPRGRLVAMLFHVLRRLANLSDTG